jgi:hypothetical protein
MAKKDPKIALFYVPSAPGDGFTGIPRRDLTERDVERLSGEQLRNATSPHPNGDPPMYQKSPPTGKRAEVAATVKDAAVPPVAVADKE